MGRTYHAELGFGVQIAGRTLGLARGARGPRHRGSFTATGYQFAANRGLSLLNAIDPDEYSIEMYFKITDVSGTGA